MFLDNARACQVEAFQSIFLFFVTEGEENLAQGIFTSKYIIWEQWPVFYGKSCSTVLKCTMMISRVFKML